MAYHESMPRPKSFDEDAVLDRAAQLFQQRGYEATSLADLEAHLGLGRQSLYNAFGDKQSLFLKALERYQRTVTADDLSHLKSSGGGLDAIRTHFRATVASLTAPGPRRTCLVANTILERGSQDADTLLRCNYARAELERALRHALAQAKLRGEVSGSLDVEAAATLLAIQTYGLNVLAKAGAPASELHAAVEVLLAGLR
jgi:TetR/AcrR family transcriptional repressor of nem operon